MVSRARRWPPPPRSDLAASRSPPQARPPRPAPPSRPTTPRPTCRSLRRTPATWPPTWPRPAISTTRWPSSSPQSGCTPDWEDGGYSLGTFNSQISALQAAGGNVIISFGGAGATELAQTCTNVSQLTAAYQNVVNTTGVTRLDFDIEDSDLADTAATSLRDQALAALQAQDPAVQVDFTLGVSPQGLPTGNGSEYAVLQDAKAKGVKVSVVNIMTMDFGDGTNDLADAESAAQGDRGPAIEPVRDLDLGGLRHDGPDAHRRRQRRRHRLLHLERPVAGELRRVQRRRRSCPSGRSTATTRGPATSTRRSSTRSPAAAAARLRRPPGAPGRLPGTRACAWTTARPAPPTSTRSRSTPATGPTRRTGP